MIEVKSFREYRKNTLQGFATILFSSIGLEVRDCCVHEKNGRRWIATPSRQYTKEDGSQGHAYVVTFPDKQMWEGFQKQALEALDKYIRKGPPHE